VATSVVEVGIDMPEATLLVVLEAERFGLAQLHQLRGRVGRGTRAGRCLLGHAGEGIPERLAILLASDDGLAIAEADLKERGPGDLLGLVQAGALDLRFADLERDLELLGQAHLHVRAWRAQGRSCPPELAALARAGGGDPAAG
jgi:ATP-dependent DNA helicase RecG